MTGLVVAISIWTERLGMFIAVAATLLWLVIPLTRWYYKRLVVDASWPIRRRMISFTVLLAAVIQSLLPAITSFVVRTNWGLPKPNGKSLKA